VEREGGEQCRVKCLTVVITFRLSFLFNVDKIFCKITHIIIYAFIHFLSSATISRISDVEINARNTPHPSLCADNVGLEGHRTLQTEQEPNIASFKSHYKCHSLFLMDVTFILLEFATIAITHASES